MKRVLFLICVLSLVANTVLAQERPEMRRENRRNTETTERQIPPGHPERVDGQNPNAEKQPMTFMQSLKLRKDVGNPQFEAGHMMLKSSRFKTASLACAAVSGGIWFFNNSKDYEVAVAGTSVIFGAAAVILYASSLLIIIRFSQMFCVVLIVSGSFCIFNKCLSLFFHASNDFACSVLKELVNIRKVCIYSNHITL